MYDIIKKVFDISIQVPFKKMKYKDAIELYGTDKPDLRYDMKFVDITELFSNTEFKIIKNTIAKGGYVKGFKVNPEKNLSRKDLDSFIKKAQFYGLPGIFYYYNGRSNIKKFITEELEINLKNMFKISENELIVFIAGSEYETLAGLGKMREFFAREFGLVKDEPFDLSNLSADHFKFLWIIDFPLFEWSEEERRFKSMHHPFTMPAESIEKVENSLLEAEKVNLDGEKKIESISRAYAYDLVLNGLEIAGGSIRIHNPEVQKKIFQLLKISEEEAKEKFSFFLTALEYGTPPHGGIAFGIERLLMALLNVRKIRDLIAFPKNLQARCLLTGAPSPVLKEQLKELNLKTND